MFSFNFNFMSKLILEYMYLLLYRRTICWAKECFAAHFGSSVKQLKLVLRMRKNNVMVILQIQQHCMVKPYCIKPISSYLLFISIWIQNLTWSLVVMMKCSFVIGGYQAIHCGTPLCSILSELSKRRLSWSLFSKSYST